MAQTENPKTTELDTSKLKAPPESDSSKDTPIGDELEAAARPRRSRKAAEEPAEAAPDASPTEGRTSDVESTDAEPSVQPDDSVETDDSEEDPPAENTPTAAQRTYAGRDVSKDAAPVSGAPSPDDLTTYEEDDDPESNVGELLDEDDEDYEDD